MLRIVVLSLCAFFLSFSAAAKELVFVHSYHFSYPWVKEYRYGFFNHIGEMNIHEFQMDTKRLPETQFQAKAEEAWQFIREKSPDVVLVADDNALRFLGPRLIEAQIPAFFLGINANPRDYVPIASSLSGVLERPLLKRSTHMVSRVIPDVKRIKIMMDANHTSNAIISTAFSGKLNQEVTGIRVETSLYSNYAKWQDDVTKTKEQGYDALIIANYAALSDVSGAKVPMDDVSDWTSLNSPVPVFAFWSYSVGPKKAVGGLSISALDQGIVAAELINEFFDTGVMPPIATPKRGAFMFSRTELRRWGLTLPEDIRKKAVLLE